VWLPGSGRSTLDLVGPGLTVLVGPRRERWDAAVSAWPSGGPPLSVEAVDRMSARALGTPEGGALIVRPDAAPVGVWPPGTEATAVSAAMSGLVRGPALVGAPG
jgi:hypothetical protein